jgi:hypothetical protein
MVYSQSWVKIRKKDYCPICNKKLKLDEEFYLTINNNKLFPNCLVHYDCISETDGVGLKWMNFTKVTKLLHVNYRKSIDSRKEHNTLYRAWGNKL